MKARRNLHISLKILVVGLAVVCSVSAYAAETYQVDPVHSSVVFRLKYQGVTYAYGRFNAPTGSLVFDEAMPAKSFVDIKVNAKDVDTAVPKRDKHARSPDFLNAEEHPILSFKSKAVKKLNQDTYEVSGNLTLLGNSRPLTVTAQETGSGKDPWGNFRRGFETTFTIKRSDFGMNFMLSGVSDEVMITVSLGGVRQ